jgi:hypothetical protein
MAANANNSNKMSAVRMLVSWRQAQRIEPMKPIGGGLVGVVVVLGAVVLGVVVLDMVALGLVAGGI